MIISLDTECTGLDIVHGARPYLVTTCSSEGQILFWEWPVDPLTRIPAIPEGDLVDITEVIDAADIIYIQNSKFDMRALASIGIAVPWPKVRDTLAMGHLLASNHKHDLTSMCVEYLGINIERFELHVMVATKACRTMVKQTNPDWVLAGEGVPGMPSVVAGSKRDEDKPWKADMWLPRAVCMNHEQYDPDWLTVCSKYANADSEYTVFLGIEMERLIRARGQWDIYQHRLQLPRVACEMECYGVSMIGDYTHDTIKEYEEYVAETEAELKCIAREYGHTLELASGAALNDNMREFFYGSVRQTCPRCGAVRVVKTWKFERATPSDKCAKCAKSTKKQPSGITQLLAPAATRPNLRLPVIVSKKTRNATLDADAMQEYIGTLEDGPALDFIKLLSDKRGYDTALTYMNAYRRFWVPVLGHPGRYRVHPSLNPFGTDHLRFASNSPNMQNVSDKGDRGNRACFGPLPGREWWRMDFKSIENRIPAYESGQEEMIELFEKPNSPPFFGSYYLLNASITCPDLFWPLAEREGAFKREQPRPYKHVKFGTLAMQYGCGEAKADKLFRMKGAFRLLKEKLPKMTALQDHYLDMAERNGHVETLPDRSVDATRGYPILASRMENGRVLSTTPFNYHVSGTACWCKNTALVRCSAQLAQWRADGFDAHMALEIHDEILFDFPSGNGPDANMARAMILRGHMEQSGEDLIPRIPTPVSVEYHAETWARGVVI